MYEVFGCQQVKSRLDGGLMSRLRFHVKHNIKIMVTVRNTCTVIHAQSSHDWHLRDNEIIALTAVNKLFANGSLHGLEVSHLTGIKQLALLQAWCRG